jgi:DNA adenine methylase
MEGNLKQGRSVRAAEPFLKWAGGKRALLAQIRPLVPVLRSDRRYFEPFVGGGSLFFALSPRRATLADVNEDLIATFASVRADVDGVIRRLRALKYEEEAYYRVRASRPRSDVGRAARFIYLNKTCFNGLYRVNKKGEFNVPFGDHGPSLLLCDDHQLRRAARALQRARLRCQDFETTVSDAQKGDVVYFDPPYTVAHTDNGFIEYNADVFAWSDQRRLARTAAALVDSGVNVVVSNADHASILRLYDTRRRFILHRIARHSTIGASNDRRFPTTELVLVSRRAPARGTA